MVLFQIDCLRTFIKIVNLFYFVKYTLVFRPSTNTTEKKLNGFSGPGINGSMNGGVKVQPSVDVEKCSTYSFVVPQFDGAVSHGNAYRTLLHDVLTLLSSHVQMGAVLLEVDDFLPNSVNEVLRVAMGKSQLLMKKRLMQFKEQLERHLVRF